MRRCCMSSRSALRRIPLVAQRAIGVNSRNRLRGFHSTKPNLIVNEALEASHQVFYIVHDATGLQWGLSIPLTACLFQLSFTPIQYLMDRNRIIRQRCTNLLVAWGNIYRKQVMWQYPSNIEGNKEKAIGAVNTSLQEKNKNLLKLHGARGNWFNTLGLLYLPIWFVNFSVLRRMCGTTNENTPFDPENSDISDGPPLPGEDGIISLEPSFTTEGLAWATDLTIADPTWLFPIFAWGLMAKMVIGSSIRSVNEIRSAGKSMGRSQPLRLSFVEAIQSLLFTYALVFGIIIIRGEVPTAVILYLIGSTSTALIRKQILSKLVGTSKSIQEAIPKRPISKKEE